jgi:protocatechuate 3,4-dioxygenase beta subunit
VLETFKGVPQSGTIEVTTAGTAAECGFKFVAGREYVVYASRSADGRLTASTCSRTAPVERASADLGYGRSIASGGVALGRIGGRVVLRFRDLANRREREQPMGNVAVTIGAEHASGEARTDRAGVFSVAGLQPGVYGLRLALPADMRASVNPDRVELADTRGCAELKLAVIPDGRVRGRVLDAARRPLAGVTIDLTPRAGLQSTIAERLRTTTGRDGRYELSGVPPGTFVVGINTRQEPDGVPRVLHPGVVDPGSAAAAVVPAGGHVDLGDLVIPDSVGIAQVAGFVVDSQGAPVEEARVYLRGPEERDFIIGEPVRTDFMGRFVISAPRDGSYQLFAERPRPGDTRGRVDVSDRIPFTASGAAVPLMLRLKRQ